MTSFIFKWRFKNLIFNRLDVQNNLLFIVDVKHTVSPKDIPVVLLVRYTASPFEQVLTDQYTACL